MSGIKCIYVVVHPSPPSTSRTFSSSRTETLPVKHRLPLLPPPGPAFCLYICLLIIPHVSKITQYLSFCVWFLSFSTMSLWLIHDVVCISISFLFKTIIVVWTDCVCLFLCPSVNIWVVSAFWLLGILLLRIYVYKSGNQWTTVGRRGSRGFQHPLPILSRGWTQINAPKVSPYEMPAG